MSHDEDVRLVDKLRHDAETCLGRDECQVPLMYCAFGPADHCHEYAALWLRILARDDALMNWWSADVADTLSAEAYRAGEITAGERDLFIEDYDLAHDKVEGLLRDA